MARWPQTCLLLTALIITRGYNTPALELSYEVLDTIVELSSLDPDFKNLTQLNVTDDLGPTRPIYRLDLDADFVAYYEIDMGSEYVVLSSGRKTGDFRKVESGPDPRPTDVLMRQAQKNGQRCGKFYRLSPMGLTICKNDNGTVVAASYNWTAGIPEIEDWRQLDQMVKQDLDGFKRQWQAWAAQKRSQSDWATTDVDSTGGQKKNKQTVAEVLSPGSIVELALGERFKSVHIYVTDSDNTYMHHWSRWRWHHWSRWRWQQKLCKVLIDVCLPDGSTEVASSAIQEKPNRLSYMKLEVHANWTFVENVLHWREIGFVVEISGSKNEVIKKHFAIDLHPQRPLHSSWTTLFDVYIPSENEMPDYDQFICCQNCRSGSGAVAWAQVFGYYDRLAASTSFSSKFSATLYGDSSEKAPLSMTDGVKSFVETIRSWLQTNCGGVTSSSDIHKIAPWFRARQGLRSGVQSYLESRKRRSNGTSLSQGSKSWIEDSSVPWLNNGYPVVFEIETARSSRHFAVATKYKQRSRQVRRCSSRTTRWWWWWWKKRSKTCWTNTENHKEFFLHYGWGGYSNKWQRVNLYSAHVAHVEN